MIVYAPIRVDKSGDGVEFIDIQNLSLLGKLFVEKNIEREHPRIKIEYPIVRISKCEILEVTE